MGDSNTWGYDPRGFGGGRWPADTRWTAILDSHDLFSILNFGENGREIPHTVSSLSRLRQQLPGSRPLDGICVMLGANDLLCETSPFETAERMENLIDLLKQENVPLLLLAPPRFQPGTWIEDENLIASSEQLAIFYREIGRARGIAFADVGEWNISLCFDGVHFSEEGNKTFAAKAEEVFRSVFCTACE